MAEAQSQLSQPQWLTFDADEEGKLTSSGGWKRRYGRLELWRFDNDYWTRPGGNPHVDDDGKLRNVKLYGSDKAALHKDQWDADHAIFDAKQRTSETAVYGYGAGGAPTPRAVAPLVGLVEDIVRSVVDAAAAPMPLPAVLEHRVLSFLDVRELSFVAAAGGLRPRASRASLDKFFATHDFTAPLVARNFDFTFATHHFGALELIRPPVASVQVGIWNNLQTVRRWALTHRGWDGAEAELRRSREEATDKLRKELAEFEKKLAEARAEAAKPDEPRPSYLSGPRWDDYWPRKCEQERQKARAHVAYYEQRVEIARSSIRRFEGDVAASVARVAAAALATDDEEEDVPSDADSDYWEAREAAEDALHEDKRSLIGLLKALADGAFLHGVVEGSVYPLDEGSVKGSAYRPRDPEDYYRPVPAVKRFEWDNETAALISLPVLAAPLLHSTERGATAAGPKRATTPARVLFIVREVEGNGIDGDIANGSTGVYCDVVLHTPAWEAVKAIAAEDPLTSRLGHLPDALLGEVLSFAGDVRDGRRERRWNDAEPEYLGPIELVNLLSYTFGYHMATGHQSLSLPSDAVAARVAGAMGVDPSQLGAVVRTVLLAANVRGNGIAHWEALESVHAFEGDPDFCLGTGYFKYKVTGIDERRREFRYPGNEPVDVFWPPAALTGGAAVAAYPSIYRPPGLEEDPERTLFYNDSPSPKGVREQLLLVLSRRLADPATLSTLPRLVSALRGQLWAKFSEYVEERVDILEAHWACDDALIDEIQAKVMRANIDSEYGKSVENPAEWEHSLDYFWDFHGPNPNPTTGYQADY